MSRLTYCNPFLPERIEFEREALGGNFVEQPSDWNIHPELIGESPNVEHILERVAALLEARATDLEGGARATEDEAALYEDLVLFTLFHRYHQDFDHVIRRSADAERVAGAQFGRTYERFAADVTHYLRRPGLRELGDADVAHFFAGLFRFVERFTTFFATSSASQSRQRVFGRRCGSRCSRTTCAAIADCSTTAWRTSRRSLLGRRGRARNSRPARSGWRATYRSIRSVGYSRKMCQRLSTR